jgi:hypothetical protein
VKQFLSKTVLLFVSIMSLQTVVAVPLLTLNLATGHFGLKQTFIAIIIAMSALALCWRFHAPVTRVLNAIAARLDVASVARFLVTTLIASGLARIVWAYMLPVSPTSDSATYLQLAHQLAAGSDYYTSGTWAYWPPGYPVYLSLWMRLGMDSQALIVTTNLLHSFAATLLTYFCAKKLLPQSGARLAAVLMSFWPSLVTASGIAQKEQLLIPLLLGVTSLALLPPTMATGKFLARGLVIGLLLGFGCLVQPSLQLYFFVLVAILLLRGTALTRIIPFCLLILVGSALAIAPWTLRNRQHFDSFVMISTNGGDNLYRANNPLATGAYTPRGERSYGGASETEINRLGFQWAIEWIKGHPKEFSELALQKQTLFLGDDSNGVYETLRRGLNLDGISYALPKLALQGWWWGVWVISCIGIFNTWRQQDQDFSAAAIFSLPLLYFWLLHSVFESSGKYHLPVTAFLPLLLASLLMRNSAAHNKQ